MKNAIWVIVCCMLIFCGNENALALTWDFEKKSEGDEWTAIRGKWEVDLKEGALVGSSDFDEGTAVVSKGAWNDKWTNYTIEVKVRNTGN